jgi:hypothetical protein
MPSGYRNARVRAAYSLPLAWRNLTEIDVAQFSAVIRGAMKKRSLDLRTLETLLLAWSILVTGRRPEEIVSLSVRCVPDDQGLAGQAYGLIRRRGSWGWWLPSGLPKDQKTASKWTGLRPWSPSIYLPATTTLVALLDRCLQLRKAESGGRTRLGVKAIPIFSLGDGLLYGVPYLLALRNPLGPDRTRRATTTPETLSRWLPTAMSMRPGGDAVPASILSGRIAAVAKTTSYYGSASNISLARDYRSSIDDLDKVRARRMPAHQAEVYGGDRLTPSDAAVRTLIARLSKRLADDLDERDRHRAMTDYTVALLSFALAHRGSGHLPTLGGVDESTGFCWITDKNAAGSPARRMVWVGRTARGQLAYYANHLKQVVGGPIDPINLSLFDWRRDKAMKLTIGQVLDRALGCSMPRNAGRHWLRSRLIGRCSSETLFAFFGHGPIDDGSWDAASGLDPVMYRADIARSLDVELSGIGWHPLDARGQSALAI